MKLLLADKDAGHLDVATYAFRRDGFSVVAATDGAAALERWEQEAPDLILLDLSLPRVAGLDVLRRIREHKSASANTPVIVLTDRSGEEDVVSGFAAGADDYVLKPFSHRQLTARIRAVLRRQGSAPESDIEIRAAGLVLDCQAHEVWREDASGDRLHLTPTEFRILRILMENVGKVVTAQRLVEYAWGYGEGDATMLKTHICHLRVKLGIRSNAAPAVIAVLPTVGYSLKAR